MTKIISLTILLFLGVSFGQTTGKKTSDLTARALVAGDKVIVMTAAGANAAGNVGDDVVALQGAIAALQGATAALQVALDVITGNTGSATYDPPALADGSGVTTTVTVTGAALGEFVVASFGVDIQGVTISAWVSATNTASVRFQNETGGAIDLASGTLSARAN